MKNFRLKTGYELKMEIQSLQETIAELKMNIGSISSAKLSERIQGGDNSPDKNIIDKISKLAELEKKLNELIEYQLHTAENIEQVSGAMNRVVLRYRYINTLTWEEIAEKTNLSTRHVMRVHDNAIKEYKKIFPECH